MNIFNVLYERISSIRLTIALCIILALVSLIGTLVPQNLTFKEYENLFGTGVAKATLLLGINDLYHTKVFFLLLLLFTSNLVICSMKRFPRVWRDIHKERTIPSNTDFKNWRYQETFTCTVAPEEIEGALEPVMAKALGKRYQQKVLNPRKRIFFIDRNRYARIGPYVVHLGIFFILLGGLAGLLFGFKGFLTLPEGTESDTAWSLAQGKEIPLDFKIRCNKFVVLHYPDGSPKEYRSEVSLFDLEGNKIIDKAIRVNHPLSYQGITFYQSTYGSSENLTLQIKNNKTGKTSLIHTDLNTPFPLPGEGEKQARAFDFKHNWHVPMEMVKRSPFPKQDLGPAARIVIFDKNGFEKPFWVFKDLPNFRKKEDQPYHFILQEFRSVSYTGLQVVKDPGTPLVWLGCILMIIGFVISFLVDHEILWAVSEIQEDNKTIIRLAGRAVRHPSIYAGRFEKQKNRLRMELAPWLSE